MLKHAPSDIRSIYLSLLGSVFVLFLCSQEDLLLSALQRMYSHDALDVEAEL